MLPLLAPLAGSLFPNGLPTPTSSSNATQGGNTGGLSVGAFTVGGASNQMYLFAGAAVLIVAVMILARKK